MRVARTIELTDLERNTLTKWSRGRATPARVVLRAKIVLLAADGRLNEIIAADILEKVTRAKAALDKTPSV
jgi:hypothetical protein